MYQLSRPVGSGGTVDGATEAAAVALVFALLAVLVPAALLRLIGVMAATGGSPAIEWAPVFSATATVVRSVGLAILAFTAVGCGCATIGYSVALRRAGRRGEYARLVEIYAAATALAVRGAVYLS